MNQKPIDAYDIIDVCLLAGKIMLESGAETYRVEDTMRRIAGHFGVMDAHSYVTPTGIFFSIGSKIPTQLIRISERSTDLEKVSKVNDISRKITSGVLAMNEAFSELHRVEASRQGYGTVTTITAAAVASGCFAIMFQAGWQDFLPSVTAGGAGFALFLFVHRLVEMKFIAEFISSAMIGLLAFFFIISGIGAELDKIIIGSVMPLVPGLLITNAVRDLIAGHLVSGLSKGAEAFLTAFAIGSGVAVVFAFLG